MRSTFDSANRPDLILRVGRQRLAVIEVKVLAGLGPKQLERYQKAEPGADIYASFSRSGWSWTRGERRRGGLSRGRHFSTLTPTVRTPGSGHARCMAGTSRRRPPKVDNLTRWGDLTEGEGFVVAMRARAAWVFSSLNPPASVEHDLVGSAAGASPVVRIFTRAALAGYWVMAEVEERMSVRTIPKYAEAATRSPAGPSVKGGLLRDGVTTSAGFDWDYLLSMWPLMQGARDNWVRRSASPKHPHDKANHRAMVAKGGPKYLGIGFGERQTRINGQCMFATRFQLAPDITLGDLVTTLEGTAELLLRMAKVELPN